MATLCLYFRNTRIKSNVGRIIMTLEEIIEINIEYSKSIIKQK